MKFTTALIIVMIVCMTVTSSFAAQNGTPFCGGTDPSKFQPRNFGGGIVWEHTILDGAIMDTNVAYMIAGILPARTGIGTHTHENLEEMIFVWDHPAEFTVDGHTSVLPARSSALCPLGKSHALYNNSDETVHYLRIAVAVEKGATDEPVSYGPVPRQGRFADGAIQMGSSLANAALEAPPQFRYARFDPTLCKWVGPAHHGKNLILNHRPWIDGNFETNWVRIGHCLLPPDTSIGYHRHDGMEEIYYVMNGTGYMTVNDHTFAVGPGDAVPCTCHDSHGLYTPADADEDLDIFVFMVSLERNKLDSTNWGEDLSERMPKEQF
jgi:mannose-6-phosphate isomerase-like protein (cupin superfamily)